MHDSKTLKTVDNYKEFFPFTDPSLVLFSKTFSQCWANSSIKIGFANYKDGLKSKACLLTKCLINLLTT